MKAFIPKWIFIIFATLLFCSATYAENLDNRVPRQNTATDLKSFVEQGAELIAEKGEKAFDAFRQKGGKWFQGNRYLFVWDMSGFRYVYPPNRGAEGEQVRDLKDADGKPIGELFIKITSSKEGKGWMHYRWPKLGEETPSWKSTYVMSAKTPLGRVYIIGSGAYDMPVQKSFIIDTVDLAAKLIESKGSKAFDIFRSISSQYIYQDTYVFVIAEDGIELFNAAFPKLEGRNVLNYKDTNGNYFVKEFINVAKSRGRGWVDYHWPRPGDVEKSQKSTYVKKVMLDGKMVVVCAGLYR
ncbi:MAG: cache domain-containing protein [Campylobacterota bacterium]|nr:cache domain-containing protein [Campylobacterota bacterium]